MTQIFAIEYEKTKHLLRTPWTSDFNELITTTLASVEEAYLSTYDGNQMPILIKVLDLDDLAVIEDLQTNNAENTARLLCQLKLTGFGRARMWSVTTPDNRIYPNLHQEAIQALKQFSLIPLNIQ